MQEEDFDGRDNKMRSLFWGVRWLNKAEDSWVNKQQREKKKGIKKEMRGERNNKQQVKNWWDVEDERASKERGIWIVELMRNRWDESGLERWELRDVWCTVHNQSWYQKISWIESRRVLRRVEQVGSESRAGSVLKILTSLVLLLRGSVSFMKWVEVKP